MSYSFCHCYSCSPMCCCHCTQPGNEPNYNTYINDRFGYQIAYPLFLKPQGEPTNNDGQVFLSKSGDAEMRAYGGYLVAFTFDEEYNNALTDNWNQKGKPVITYKARSKDWFVVSGTIAKKIFLQKEFLQEGHNTNCHLLISNFRKINFRQGRRSSCVVIQVVRCRSSVMFNFITVVSNIACDCVMQFSIQPDKSITHRPYKD